MKTVFSEIREYDVFSESGEYIDAIFGKQAAKIYKGDKT